MIGRMACDINFVFFFASFGGLRSLSCGAFSHYPVDSKSSSSSVKRTGPRRKYHVPLLVFSSRGCQPFPTMFLLYWMVSSDTLNWTTFPFFRGSLYLNSTRPYWHYVLGDVDFRRQRLSISHQFGRAYLGASSTFHKSFLSSRSAPYPEKSPRGLFQMSVRSFFERMDTSLSIGLSKIWYWLRVDSWSHHYGCYQSIFKEMKRTSLLFSLR